MHFDEPPSVSEELARKTVEQLETLVHRVERNRMTKAELAVVSKALWNITSGLVDFSISELCSTVADSCGQVPIKRHFVGKGTTVTLAWFPDRAGYVIQRRDALSGDLAGKPTARAVDVGERETELKALFNTLKKSGYVEL
jgi:hypothetical protein